MNIARINMSTIQHKEHKVLIDIVKKAAKINKTKCGIMIDLQGPVIRTGEFKDDKPVTISILITLDIFKGRPRVQTLLQKEISWR